MPVVVGSVKSVPLMLNDNGSASAVPEFCTEMMELEFVLVERQSEL